MIAPAPCLRCGHPRTAEARFCQRCGTSFSPSGDPLLGEVLLGRYRVVRLLGEGTMGRVYQGEQRVGEAIRHVAIKVLASARGNDDYIVARFRREASTIASLEHPNIIKLYDYGEENGRFLSVMEYVPGGSLASLLARGRLAPQRVESILWQIASALDVAHRSGVVHRDLKPENVLLASTLETGGADVVKVVDFGIARRPPTTPDERPLTITGAMLGTPAFMAPEQFMGEAADARADVYALGLVVYQLLTGTLPFAAATVMEWGDAHRHSAPRPLRSHPGCEQLPERYDLALAHALAKDLRQRTATALDLAREFTGASQPGSLAVAQPPAVVPGAAPNATEDLQPPMKRTPWGLVALGLSALALAASGAAYMVVRSLMPHDTAAVTADASMAGDGGPAAPASDAAMAPTVDQTAPTEPPRDASARPASPTRRPPRRGARTGAAH